MLALVGAVGVIAAMVWRTRYALRACFSLMTALWIGLGTVAYPLLDAHSSGRAIMQRARDVAGPAVSLGLVGWREQNLLQAVGPVAEFGFKRPASEQFLAASSWLRSAPLQRALFAEASSIPACVDTTKVIALGQSNRREWVLLRADALARCALSP